MKIIKTKFKDLKIFKHNSFKDKRGFLRITHNQKKINKKFIFEYCATSKKFFKRISFSVQISASKICNCFKR